MKTLTIDKQELKSIMIENLWRYAAPNGENGTAIIKFIDVDDIIADILAELAGQESDKIPKECTLCEYHPSNKPAKAETKTGKCDCQVWEGIDRNGFCRICGGEPRSILSYTESEPVKDEAKKKPDHHNDIYGPGDDNYGRNKPFWKAEAKTAEEVLNEVQGGFERITYQIAIRAMKIYASQQPTKETKGMTPEEFFKSRLQKPDKDGIYHISGYLLHEYMEHYASQQPVFEDLDSLMTHDKETIAKWYLSLVRKPEITDEEIEEWANQYDEETYHEPSTLRFIQYGCYVGAKAYRDGLIFKSK